MNVPVKLDEDCSVPKCVHYEIIVIFHCVGDIDFLRELRECSDKVPLQLCGSTQANKGFCDVK